MTRKDFELIAATIKALPDTMTRGEVAWAFMRVLKRTNPAFKPDTFLEACREKEEEDTND